jgi:hypothetical protein
VSLKLFVARAVLFLNWLILHIIKDNGHNADFIPVAIGIILRAIDLNLWHL